MARTVRLMLCLLLLSVLADAGAADIQPGLWEVAVKSGIVATPDFSPMPITMNQCLTEQDAQDPSRILGGAANPGATDCTYTEKSFSGNRFRFSMKCAGSLGVQARGEITFTATSMDGIIISTANTAGETTVLRSTISARRIGGC